MSAVLKIVLWALSGITAWEWFNNRAQDGEGSTAGLLAGQFKWLVIGGVAVFLGWSWLKKRGA